MKNTKITIFGLGFVGLTTAVGFALKLKNNQICGYELDKQKAQMINNNKIPFFEAGLEAALNSTLNKNLTITDNELIALENAKIIFYCIGTPMDKDGSANLNYLLKALKSTVDNIDKCAPCPILVLKSTIPPGSLAEVFLPFLENLGLKNNRDFVLANNPEFLREGYSLDDFINPDRVVIGGFGDSRDSMGFGDNSIDSIDSIDSKDYEIPELKEIYTPFNAPIIFVNPNTAEFIKYLSNTMLSMMISYANEMSIIAQTIGNIDIKKAFNVLHLDKRFSGNPANIISYIYPGMGFGGYCLPKDTLALYKKAKDRGFESGLLKDILEINNDIIDFHINSIKKESIDSRIGILGLSFKPNSDDVRDSKAGLLIDRLLQLGYKNIVAYDPMAMKSFQKSYDFAIEYKNSLDAILQSCDVFIIATAWEEFKQVFHKIPHTKIYNLRYM
ncbi:UDP-glucose 6-dehydrogenase [Helicobacter sp. 16-1353]|uniref:UDP binding domain-containing protein n=1 Tax=Helicobacter sp. 16-1353 TaxID=2004996 RepID=UPI000DCDF985|nr:UDP binding domain-containing protein [Helicobacter sp. 16-1353]RAX54197.1 UDP-glucose 6-dehydrogenase [Helicobacter sp. 16-1353]